ncbi:MAG: hypothetical protein CMF96_02580 [Candidatus Marinimicrobia bacterium]|nr:hypothetical protein [Candidatus Neomarinimicrobiota bacterium]
MKIFILLCITNILSAYCVTFNVDITNIDAPEGNYALLMNGSWNGWGLGYELEQTSEGGFFSGTFCGFNNGDYQYVHSLTGEFDSWSGWGEVGNPPLGSSCDFNPNDSYQNYGFTINNGDVIIPLNSWNCCGTNNCSNWDGCNAGSIRTDDSYLYGRFEVRMKSADGDGIVSSFFTYNTDWENNLGNLNWNEIDIEMTGNRDSSVQFTTHHPGDPNSWSYGEIIDIEYNPHFEFHEYAFEWTPNSIKWFIDSQLVYQQTETIVDDLNLSQKIIMNIWPAIWESWVGEWDEEDTPKHSYYDYVRYYEYVPGYGNYGTENNFQLVWEDNLDFFNNNIWEDNSSGSFEGNLCSFTPLNTNFYNGYLVLSLTDIDENIECNQVNGDINTDGNLDVIDIVSIIELILSEGQNPEGICQLLAIDTDCNQSVDILDIVQLVAIIIN